VTFAIPHWVSTAVGPLAAIFAPVLEFGPETAEPIVANGRNRTAGLRRIPAVVVRYRPEQRSPEA